MEEAIDKFLNYPVVEKGFFQNTKLAYQNDLHQLASFVEEEVAKRSTIPPWAAFDREFMSRAVATRVFTSDTAVEIVNKGAELLGSIAISEDFPYEKCLIDAKVTQLWLGGQEVSRYKVARGYIMI